VYAASEGLSVLALEQRAYGGRRAPARASKTTWAFLLAFPAAPGGRAYVQAQKFGVEIATPASAASLLCDGWPCASSCATAPGAPRTVVLSCGARYRRLAGQPEDL
jgi:thioredoxin reductase (NADPH)